MSLSPAVTAAVGRTGAAARALLSDLRDAGDVPGADSIWAEIALTVTRYLQMVEQGMTERDLLKMLAGLNLLTTVNRGVGDAERSPSDAGKGEKAFALSRAASDAARLLRGEGAP